MRLSFDHSGTLTGQEACPRGVGTTVAVADLFSRLPVRHREFLRNVKREFAKLVTVLQVGASEEECGDG